MDGKTPDQAVRLEDGQDLEAGTAGHQGLARSFWKAAGWPGAALRAARIDGQTEGQFALSV